MTLFFMAGKSGRLAKPANLGDLERLNKNGGLWSMEIYQSRQISHRSSNS